LYGRFVAGNPLDLESTGNEAHGDVKGGNLDAPAVLGEVMGDDEDAHQ
jgi:hypothetical protein